MWFDYGEMREKKLSVKEDLFYSFYTLLKLKGLNNDHYLIQNNNCIDA
jgi:hypothetical protein